MDTKQKLEQVNDLLQKLYSAYDEVAAKQVNPVDKYFLDKISEWANKIHGISNGYSAEFLEMYKHRTIKGRTILGSHADVSIGDSNSLIAKSIQMKSTTQADPSAVSNMIREAANQLAGERGELPRSNDRLVIDMSIHSSENPWPSANSTMGSMTIDEFQTAARDKLFSLITTYQQHVRPKNKRGQPRLPKVDGYGMSYASLMKLTDTQNPQRLSDLSNNFPKSTQLVHQVNTVNGPQYEKVIHLTVKIRYKQGFPIRQYVNGLTSYKWLSLAVFNIHRSGNNLTTDLVKEYYFP